MKANAEECFLRDHSRYQRVDHHETDAYMHERKAASPRLAFTRQRQKQGIPIPKTNNVYAQFRELRGQPSTQKSFTLERMMRFDSERGRPVHAKGGDAQAQVSERPGKKTATTTEVKIFEMEL